MRLAPPDLFSRRLARLTDALEASGLDALIVSTPANIAYLTGFFGSAGIALVLPGRIRLISDARYQASLDDRQRDWPQIEPVITASTVSYEETLVREMAAVGGLRVGFEEAHLTVRRHRALTPPGSSGASDPLVPTDGLVESLRVVKDDWELRTLRDAATRLSDVAKCILPRTLEGLTERDVAIRLEADLQRAGFERVAFDTIVAAGANGARPHHRAGGTRISGGDLVVLDFGGVLDGYAVDLTRTVTIGPATARQRRVLDAVASAHAGAIARVAPGVAPDLIDAAARGTLVDAGFGEAFSHGTGHGLGLDVHERPRVGPARPQSPDPALVAGMVFTIEPGAYFPGWGGVRIEDDVMVTAEGGELITDVPVFL